ncbi:uncharacterized protein [Lepisosteus oculatus]|uniref:uncharacterized protein n=1 Tax=Lepisosteus oculatus TaxID=7918 RepID=UPI0035F4FF63
MKLVLFSVMLCFLALFPVGTDSKVKLLVGLNGGLVNGLNPGLVVNGLTPALLNGGGLTLQPQIAQVVPGVPSFLMQQPGLPVNPFGLPFSPGLAMQPGIPQIQGQLPPPPNGGLMYYVALPQTAQNGMNPLQQPILGGPVPPGNVPQQQAAGGLQRAQRSIDEKADAEQSAAETQPL